MIYEMRTYKLKIGKAAEFLNNFQPLFEKRQKISRLLGMFFADIGDLNRVMHIWEFEDAKHRDEVRAEAMKESWWPPKSADIILEQSNKLLVAPPFRPEPRLGENGGVYEVRTYGVQTGKMNEVISRWTEHLPERESVSPLAACFTSEFGTLNEFIHIWAYKDLLHRAEIREATKKLANWPPGSGPFLTSQNSEVWIPASFSLMH